jgi:pimeloyl-ACP methyl ester carboxylesterase
MKKMSQKIVVILTLMMSAFGVLFSLPLALADEDWSPILTIDHAVPHISTVPANAGQQVNLFVRERVRADVDQQFKGKSHDHYANGKVVLFVHGASIESVAAFDFQFKDYSWAGYLAQAGFDVFVMDLTGYGLSPRPKMDDPCNVYPAQQPLIIPNPLAKACSPSYPFYLATSQSEWDEIDSVVDYLRANRKVKRVNLVGYSLGGPRMGGYASRHPEKVDKLILDAPVYVSTAPSDPPAQVPAPGFPMYLQSYGILQSRWFPDVHCADQVEPGIFEIWWGQIMAFDPIGDTWGSRPGIMRVPMRQDWGWNAEFAAKIIAPTLLTTGEYDTTVPSAVVQGLFSDLGTKHKVLIKVACASHFMPMESQRHVLHEASKEWLLHGSVHGIDYGVLSADADGHIGQ